MEITFKEKSLERLANDNKVSQRKLGNKCAKKLHLRLQALRSALSLEDVRNLPGRFHELTTNRKGQWSCDLEHPYRLIFEPHEDPIPINDQGGYIWCEIKGIEVVEIIDYH